MVKKMQQLDGRTEAKKSRLLFATACVAAVFPGVRDDQQPKRVIFDKAATLGAKRKECPLRFRNNKSALQAYIAHKWPRIRIALLEQFDLPPVYVNGAAFGGGGGYRKGDLKHARKQLERDTKIADGVVSAANDYAEATLQVFPQIEATRKSLVTRSIGR